MRTLQAEWEKFSKACVPPGASPEQVADMRRTFYAGAFSVLAMEWEISGGDEGDTELSDDACIAIIENWHLECHAALMIRDPRSNTKGRKI